MSSIFEQQPEILSFSERSIQFTPHHLRHTKQHQPYPISVITSIMLSKSLLLSLLPTALAFPSPELSERQSGCPNIHIFGARETTAAPGYGSASTVVNLILNSHPGATAEAINYPASGSNPTYSQSVLAGTNAVCSQVRAYAQRCPNSKLVLVGYSQGAEIFDNALCGGGDPNQGISSTCSIASYNIATAIFQGDPRFQAGAPYNVGTCRAGGVS